MIGYLCISSKMIKMKSLTDAALMLKKVGQNLSLTCCIVMFSQTIVLG